MKKVLFPALIILALYPGKDVLSHCEVPCGIYNDEIRIALLYEHFTTIEKAMNQVDELSQAGEVNYNQLIRWTMTKEEHAKEIQHVVTQYFITQRVKLPESTEGDASDKYVKQLSLLHELIVYAMKAKQTTDVSNVEKMRASLAKFEEVYFEGKHRHKIEESH
jgi:nickel superoxide dismutase